MSKVSVIVPVYNTKNYLNKCLDSLISQSYSNYEIIVINDGSTDGSKEVIEEYERKYSNIIVINQNNLGLSVARNIGIKVASGKYLAFVDGDDYLGRDFILNLVNKAEVDNADMVVCGYCMVDDTDREICSVIPINYKKFEMEEWTCRIMAACFRLINKEFWTKNNLNFTPGIWGEDIPIVLFLNAMCDKISISSSADYFYVQHNDSIHHRMRGINNVKMPYEIIQDVCLNIKRQGCKNSTKFFVISVMKVFTMFLFDLGRGAEKNSIKYLCDYIYRIMNIILPEGFKIINIKEIWNIKFPLLMRIEIIFFYILLKSKLVFPVAFLYCNVAGCIDVLLKRVK